MIAPTFAKSGEESPNTNLIKLRNNSCEMQPGIRLTIKVVHDRATFNGQSQNLEPVPQRLY